MERPTVSNKGLMACLAASLVLLILSYLFVNPLPETGDAGLCFPSPNQWVLPRFLGWLLNAATIYLSVIIFSMLNRRFNLVPGPDYVLQASITLILCCNPLTSITICGSTLLLLCSVIMLLFLFETYERFHAPQEYFAIATFISIGTMILYSFLIFIPIFLVGGFIMKSMRIKEFLAFLLGLMAPYWTVLGLGIVPLDGIAPDRVLQSLRLPGADHEILFEEILICAITGGLALIFTLYNGIILFSRNAKLRSQHYSIHVLGIFSILAAFVDYINVMAYFGLMALWLSVELGTIFDFHKIRYSRYWISFLLALYLAIYILMI